MSDLRHKPAEMKARGYDPETVEEAKHALKARKTARQLIAEIEAAFGQIPRPTITRSVARGYDDEWILSDARAQVLAARDPETDWREVSDEAIMSFQEYFTFADAEGCHFYLPAYTRHYLKEFSCSGYDAVYRACTQPEKLQALNERQRTCVEKFLALCHQYQD